MFGRILRSTIVFAVVIAAYQAYVLFAVPRMERPLAVKEKHSPSQADLDKGKNAVSKYQRLLLNYFPKDHWSQIRTPKVLGPTEQVIFVIDEYTRQENGGENDRSTQLNIKRFAMLVFPTPAHEGVTGPRDAIILEAEQGARLLINDFHPELGSIGQIVRGEFPGPVVIRSDMNESGPEDDLLVETSDLQMNTKLLYTASPVRFRMGRNVGGGRELEIRFLADEHSQAKDAGQKIAGFDSLEIRHDVRMRMELDTASLLPGGKTEPSPNPSLQGKGINPSVQVSNAAKAPAPPKPPVDITCNGSFTFDFVRYMARIDRDVVVRQFNPNGPFDQLNCNQLDIHFAPKAATVNAKGEPVVVDPSMRQQRDLGRLEAVAIVALGHPAIAVSPARKVEARGDQIQIALREQRLRIEGGKDTRLTSGANMLQAPIITYQQPEKASATPIGQFSAAGPGSLHFVMDSKKPDQVFQAAWQKSVQLGREKGQPVIVMEGRPELAFGSSGSLMGDQIRLYLRELEGNSTAGFAIGGVSGDKQKQSRLAPDRLIAIGNVQIASQQLAGRTQQLLANFQIPPEPAAAPANPGGARANDAKTAPAAPPNKPNAAPKNAQQAQHTYQVVADQMRLEVFMKGQTAVPTTLACDGNIVVREVSPAGTNQQPAEIRGGRLTVDKLDTKTPHITLRGESAGAGASVPNNAVGAGGSQLAQLSGRGVTLLTDAVEMDGRDNHMWSDGPGEATVLMARDLQGNAIATPTPVKIRWQNGLQFDGQTITFDQNVVVSSADSTLRCNRMLARLAAPLQFGQHLDQSATSFSQIDCEGRVAIENLSRDLGGVTSHDRMQLGHLTINQQTGEIRGQGPGVIRSTRFGNVMGPLAGPQDAKPQAASPAANAPGSKLHFLRVDFHTGLDGNIYTRMLTFHDRVRTVYGPVDAWEQELELTRPETLPPESMTLSCDKLRLNEDPAAARSATANPSNIGAMPIGAIQLEARHNVKIEGQSLAQGQFSIQADRASYDKAKELFILEGDTRTPAKLWRRTAAGDSPPYEARKIYYNRSTNQAKAEGIQYLEISPGDVEKARRQPAVPAQTR